MRVCAVRYIKYILSAGSACNSAHHNTLATRAYTEFSEFQWQQSSVEFAQRFHASVLSNDRLEIMAFTDHGDLAGILVLVDDDDEHVGRCVSVHWQYILPEHRNTGIARQFMRAAIQCAEQGGYSVLAYSHRVGPGEYSIKYRRINGQKN